jgi:hypothetical protein
MIESTGQGKQGGAIRGVYWWWVGAVFNRDKKWMDNIPIRHFEMHNFINTITYKILTAERAEHAENL